MSRQKNLVCLFLGMVASSAALSAAEKLKALIVDGQNNHLVWPKSTVMMKQYLKETGKVTQEIPKDFPTADGTNSLKFEHSKK
jgi:uncharacterized protein